MLTRVARSRTSFWPPLVSAISEPAKRTRRKHTKKIVFSSFSVRLSRLLTYQLTIKLVFSLTHSLARSSHEYEKKKSNLFSSFGIARGIARRSCCVPRYLGDFKTRIDFTSNMRHVLRFGLLRNWTRRVLLKISFARRTTLRRCVCACDFSLLTTQQSFLLFGKGQNAQRTWEMGGRGWDGTREKYIIEARSRTLSRFLLLNEIVRVIFLVPKQLPKIFFSFHFVLRLCFDQKSKLFLRFFFVCSFQLE